MRNKSNLDYSTQNDAEKISVMYKDILKILEIVKENDMDKRTPIPKIKHNRQAKSALATANNSKQSFHKYIEYM